MAKQNITLSAHTAYQTTAGVVYLAIARLRWPGYQIQGAGSIAVVWECSHRVVLTMTPMEAAALAADPCCATCDHGRAPGANLHHIHTLEPRQEPQRRSMSRLPGWDKD